MCLYGYGSDRLGGGGGEGHCSCGRSPLETGPSAAGAWGSLPVKTGGKRKETQTQADVSGWWTRLQVESAGLPESHG